MMVTAQVSLYPLRQPDLTPAIDRTIRFFQQQGLHTEPGPMSTLISGPLEQVFHALQEAFDRVAAEGQVVMVVTFSNACPVDTKDR